MTPCQKLLKQEGTARRIESMQQSSTTQSLHLWFLGVAEDCCMLSILLAVPSCFNSFWHGVIPTSYFIFNDFYTCTKHKVECLCMEWCVDHCTLSHYCVQDARLCVHMLSALPRKPDRLIALCKCYIHITTICGLYLYITLP